MSLKLNKAKIPSAGGHGAWRMLMPAALGGLGAYLLSDLSDFVLQGLYRFVAGLISKSPPADAFKVDSNWSQWSFALLGAILGAFLGDRLLRWLGGVAGRWDRMDVGDKVNVFLGAFAGLIGSVPFLVLFDNLAIPSFYKGLAVVGVILGLSMLSIYMLQSMAEVLPWSRSRPNGKRSGMKLLDTNVIIDGRIYDVAKTGFLEGEIYVPGFVLEELQYIADSHDALRRQRGRRGLEVLRHMQADFPMEVRIHDKLAPEANDGVDSRLVRLAKALGADIVTNDFNLNRVADLQGIRVLNLNELSMSLRPNVLPAESLEITLVKEGNQAGQGVGYLEDGTMVVVENGRPHLGETVEVIVTQVIQTERGKMIFAKAEENGSARAETQVTMRKPGKRPTA